MPIDPVNNANQITNIGVNANQVGNIGIGGPPIIPTINPPVTKSVTVPVVRGLDLPVVQLPNTGIKYPTVDVPTQEEFDAAVKEEQKKQEKEEEEERDKPRGLPNTNPTIPKVPQLVQTPPVDEGTNEENNTNTNLGVPVIEVPIIGEVPVPPKEQVILAGTTATASVAAALAGKSFVEYMVKKFKPVVERIFAQIKKAMSKDLTDYELQLFFAYEHQKKINKILKKEFKKQKMDQFKKANNK